MRKRLATPEGREKERISEEEAREFRALTPQTFAAQLATVFDAAIARDRKSYSRARKIQVLPPPSQVVQSGLGLWRGSDARFRFERNLVTNRLFQGALELRALKLETGTYPTTFNAPLDPFSDGKPLVYRRDGATYRLYSIGPDGKDDDGRVEYAPRGFFNGLSIENRETKRGLVVFADFNGDLPAPVF